MEPPAQCPPGTKFDKFGSPPDCYPADQVDQCDIDECVEGHDCHPLGQCENTIGSYICSCVGNYNEFNAGEVDSLGDPEYKNMTRSYSFRLFRLSVKISPAAFVSK